MTSHSRPNPYVGPRAFKEGETLYGRDREENKLLNLLIAERIVLFCSPSGAGKTSLLQAASIPELQKAGFQVFPVIRVNIDPSSHFKLSSVGNRYIFSTLSSLEKERSSEQQMSLEELAGLELAAYLDQREVETAETDKVVLVFDQFEEILTADPTDLPAKKEFFTQLGKTLRRRHRWALFSMREEYLAGLDPYLRLIPTRLSTRFRLDLLEEKAARQTIREPASQAGVPFTKTAAAKLTDDLRRTWIQQPDGATTERVDPYIEPVQLQVVCHRVWEALPEGATEIREADIQESGDVNNALADYYANRMQAIAQDTGGQERVIREWFEHQLITRQGFRRQVLQGTEQSQGLDNRVIELLVNAYLVRTENRRGSTWYELAHDRLIDPVRQNNADWRERHLSTLQRQAALWESQERPSGLLLRDEALEEAERWAADHRNELTSTEHDFLAGCQEARAIAERERQQNRRIRRLAFVATAISVIAIIAFLVAFYFFRQAQERLEKALWFESLQIASAATNTLRVDPELSILLAIQALSVTYTIEAENALRQALQTSRVEHTFSDTSPVRAVAFSPDGKHLASASDDMTIKIRSTSSGQVLFTLSGHEGRINRVTFSPDGTLLATVGADKTVRVWDARSGELLQTLNHQYDVWDAAFSPDGQHLATALGEVRTGDGAAVIIWDMASGKALQTLLGHVQEVRSVSFSPDGKSLATAGIDKTIILWDTASGTRVLTLNVGSTVYRVAFSPQGNYLAASCQDGVGRLWDLSTPDSDMPLFRLVGHASTLISVAFSPNGKRLATVSLDNTAKIWDASNGLELLTLSGHTNYVVAAAFNLDGMRLATASLDKTIRIWNIGPTREPLGLSGHPDLVRSVVFSPDGKRLVTASDDSTAKIWEAVSGKELFTLPGHTGRVYESVFSPDGMRLATASEDKTAKIWDAASGQELLTLSGHSDRIGGVAFSPDGMYLATGSYDGTAKIWDTSSGSEIRTFSGHTDRIRGVAFSPDGKLLATASDDETAKIWDAVSGKELSTLSGHAGWVMDVTFNPDGTLLATAGIDGTAKLWDHDVGEVLHTFSGHYNRLWSVTFSSEGKRLATTSSDRTTKVWSATPPYQELHTLGGYTGAVFHAAFSPDTKHVAAAGLDGKTSIVRIYTLDREELMALAQQRVTRTLKPVECQKYLHQEQCP